MVSIAALYLALAWLCMIFVSLTWMSLPPIISLIIEEMALSFIQAGLLISASMVFGLIFQFVVGMLVDRYGLRRLAIVILCVLFASAFLAGWVESYAQLFAVRLLIGLAPALFPVLSRPIADHFPSNRLGFAHGFFAGGSPLGIGLAAFIMPILAEGFGWRLALTLSSIPLAGLIAAFAFLLKDSAPAPSGRTLEKRIYLRVVHLRFGWLVTWLNVTFFGAALAVASWLPTYFKVHYGLDLASAGLTVAAALSLGAASRPLGGFLADKHGIWKTLLFTSLILTAVYAVLSLNATLAVSMASVFILGWMLMFGNGAAFRLPLVKTPRDAGTVIGFASSLGLLIGGIILPLAMGFIADLTGYFSIGFLLLAAITLSTLLISGLMMSRKEGE